MGATVSPQPPPRTDVRSVDTYLGYGLRRRRLSLKSRRPEFEIHRTKAGHSIDWFNVRHMSGPQGRFQSVDPANAGADLTNPQTWNAYAYVGNNPLSYTDPSGTGFWSTLFDITLDIGKVCSTSRLSARAAASGVAAASGAA